MAEPGRRCHQPPWGSGQGGGKTPGQACGCRGDLHSPGAPPRPGPHCRLLQPARFLELELACCDVGPNFLAHQEQSPSAEQLSESAASKSSEIAILTFSRACPLAHSGWMCQQRDQVHLTSPMFLSTSNRPATSTRCRFCRRWSPFDQVKDLTRFSVVSRLEKLGKREEGVRP